MKYCTLILLALLAFEPAFSKGSRSSGGSSRSSSFSRSSFSSPKPSFKPSATKPSTATKPTAVTTTSTTTGPTTKPTSKSNVVTQKYKSQTDKAAYEKAVKSGTAFKTRDEAVSSFKTQHGSKYTSKYTSEPATRPSHIPQTTEVGGRSYNVTYNQGMGGYGYMNSLGTWMMFDAMTDMVVMTSLMNNHGYYHGSPYQAAPQVVGPVQQQSNVGFTIFIGILSTFVILGVIFFIANQ